MTKLTELLENATREQLLETLSKIAEKVEKHEEVTWESHCPEDIYLSGNYDDTWEAGQDNGESYMANSIEGLIRATLDKTLES